VRVAVVDVTFTITIDLIQIWEHLMSIQIRTSGHRGLLDNILLRGGRMTKWKGQVASFAPSFGMATSAIAVGAGLMLASPAYAADECGIEAAGADTLNCAGGAYPNGISYANSDGLTLVLNDPAITVGPTVGAGVAVRSDLVTSNAVIINATSAGTVTVSGAFSNGLHALNMGLGEATVMLGDGYISTTMSGSTAVKAEVGNTASTAAATATMMGGTITATGVSSSHALNSVNLGLGEATATLSGGDISTSGNSSFGVAARVDNAVSTAAATVTMTGGAVTTTGIVGRGLFSLHSGLGEATATLSGGDISTSGDIAEGISVEIANAGSTATASATVTGGTVTTTGLFAPGIFVRTTGLGETAVTLSAGTIAVSGDYSDGIYANSAGGTYDVDMTGGIVTSGTGIAAGIHTMAAAGGTVDIGAAATIDGSASGIAIRDGDEDFDGVDDIGGDAVVTTAGTVTGDAILGFGNDMFNLAGGTYNGTIHGDDVTASAADGDDVFNWTGGTLIGGFNGGDGSDTATVAATAYDGSQLLDGGDNADVADGFVDELSLDGVTATVNGGKIVNWEVVSLTDSDLTLNDFAAPTLNVCGGSTTLGGASMADDVLGCVSDDIITLTGDTAIANVVEGAGGSDTIAVLGNASVAGGVYGGGEGSDASAAADTGDTITINTTGTVALVDGQLGDDVIALTAGTITGGVAGGDGNDAVTLAGATVAGAITGDAGDDSLTWTSGTLGSFNGGIGSDTVTVSVAGYDGSTVLDGGDDASSADGWIDTLNLNGVTGTVNGGNLQNWEVVNVTGGPTTITDLVTETGGVCGGSLTLDGASSATDVLGCVSDDIITLTGDTAIANVVEGAGGSDMIAVLGNASVAGGVYGGGDGQDMSAVSDTGDVITINTTGTVALVDAGLGDDLITLAGGTVTGDVLGGDGDDALVWSGGTLAGFNGGDGSDTATVAAAEYDGSQLLDGGDDASSADGFIDALTLKGLDVTANGTSLVNWEVATLDDSKLTIADGSWTVGDAGDDASGVFLTKGSELDGGDALTLDGNVAIDATSRFTGTGGGAGVYAITGNLTNAGIVSTQDGAVGDVLTVGGNYVGQGGQLLLDAVLDDGSGGHDRLLVNGDFTGTSTVDIANVGGTGALTTGDGIKLVQVDGTSAAGALILKGGTIDTGAYRYSLNQGGIADPNDGDFYLRSRARDIVTVATSLARASRDLGRESLGTLHERVGEQEHDGLQTPGGGILRGLWGRALGSSYSDTAKSAAYGNARSNGEFGGTQLGVDLYRGVSEGGSSTHIGVYGGHLWSGTRDYQVTPTRLYAGTTRSEGWVAGAYATHYGKGWYVDAVLQRSWLDHKANATDGTRLATQSREWLGSIELGAPLSLGSGVKFEPQVQLIYGRTRFDDALDSSATLVGFDLENSLTGRAGFRLKRTRDLTQANDGSLFTAYLKANVWKTLDGGETSLTFGSSAPGTVTFPNSWADVGFGTTFSLMKNADLFFDGDVAFGIDQGTTALSGRTGLRIRW